MAGYAGYSGYDPAEEARVKRLRETANMLGQSSSQQRPIRHWTQGVAQLAEAWLAKDASREADKAETAYSDNRKKAADMLINAVAPGDASMAAYGQYEPSMMDKATALASGSMPERDGFNGFTPEQQAAGERNARLRALTSYMGDPMAAISADQVMNPGPDYQLFQGQDGAITRVDKTAGKVQQVQPGTPKPKNPIIIGNNAYDPETYQPIIQGEAKPNLPDGWQMGENGPEPIPGYAEWYRKMHPGDGAGSGTAQFVDVPPAEMEALGYPKGTLGKRNTKTNELQVTSRPSTQMTGQPTESERKYAFYAKNAKHGLDVVNSMETKQGFNRADGWTWATSWTNQDARSYDQGMSQFIDSWLRAMTGAAATPSEIEFYKQQWTPQLGDGPDVIKQKRDARNQAVVDMEAAAGRGLPQGATPAPVASESAPAGPTFPDGTPITPETLQQLSPEMRQFWERKLPAQQSNQTEDAFIDGLFSDQGAGGNVPQEAVADLMSDPSPEAQAQFDEVFGQGAAASILNGTRQ